MVRGDRRGGGIGISRVKYKARKINSGSLSVSIAGEDERNLEES